MSVGHEGLENLSSEAGDPHGYGYIRQDLLVNIKGVAGDFCEVSGDDDETEEPCDYIGEHDETEEPCDYIGEHKNLEDLIGASDSCEVTGKAMKGQCDGCNIGYVEVPHSPWGGTEYIKEPKMQASLTPAKAKGKRPKPKKTRPGGPQHFESGVKTVTAEEKYHAAYAALLAALPVGQRHLLEGLNREPKETCQDPGLLVRRPLGHNDWQDWGWQDWG
jgi:hypothetical protein